MHRTTIKGIVCTLSVILARLCVPPWQADAAKGYYEDDGDPAVKQTDIQLPINVHLTTEPKKITSLLITPHEPSPNPGNGCGTCAVMPGGRHPLLSFFILFGLVSLFPFLHKKSLYGIR